MAGDAGAAAVAVAGAGAGAGAALGDGFDTAAIGLVGAAWINTQQSEIGKHAAGFAAGFAVTLDFAATGVLLVFLNSNIHTM